MEEEEEEAEGEGEEEVETATTAAAAAEQDGRELPGVGASDAEDPIGREVAAALAKEEQLEASQFIMEGNASFKEVVKAAATLS